MDNYDNNNVESSQTPENAPNEEQNQSPVSSPQENSYQPPNNPYEPPNQTNYSVDSAPQKSNINVAAVVGFIMSIVSLFIFGIPLGIAALIVSLVGLLKGEGNKGLAIAGIVISIIAIILAILGALFLISFNSYYN